MPFLLTSDAAYDLVATTVLSDTSLPAGSLIFYNDQVYLRDELVEAHNCGWTEDNPCDGWTKLVPAEVTELDSSGVRRLSFELRWASKVDPNDSNRLISARVHISDPDLVETSVGFYLGADAAILDGFHLVGSRWYGEGESVGLQDYDTVQTIADTTSEAHPFLVGLEVEKEDGSFCDFTETGEWLAVRDGSLGDGGFELVSPAFNLTKNKSRISKMLDQVDSFLDANTTTACGGHINLSQAGLSGKDLLARIEDCIPLLYAMFPRRLSCDFTAPNVKIYEEAGKYRAVRVGGDRIEFRIFSRVTSREQLEWRIRLIKHFVEFGRLPIGEALKDKRSRLWALLREVYTDDKIEQIEKMYEPFLWYYDKGLRHPLVLKYLPQCLAAENAAQCLDAEHAEPLHV